MIAKFMTRNKQITFEIEADTQVELFQEIASLQEVFDTELVCGLCDSQIRFQHRIVDGNNYHELVCTHPKCRAKFEFGHSKEQTGKLFPAKKDKQTGKYVRSKWVRFQGTASSQQSNSGGEPWE